MDSAPTTALPPRWRTYSIRAAIWLLIAAVLAIALVEGLHVRRWVYDFADPIRFSADMNNGCYWGLQASGPEGYFNQYDKMALEQPDWMDSKWSPYLDYSPLRLLVMREWAVWQRANHPPDPDGSNLQAWQRPYEFTAPMLRFNIALELCSATCAFFLTRLWVRRGSNPQNRTHFLGVWQGILAALFFWFSPDIIVNAHAWPQWDTWLIPFYLFACLMGSLDCWFAAGVSVAVGAMFKGQILSTCPIFILWPIVQRRPGGALRWACGMIFGITLIASAWLITYLPADKLAAAYNIQADHAVRDYPADLYAIPRTFDFAAAVWIVEMLIVTINVPFLLRRLPPSPYRRPIIIAGGLVIAAAVYWPWFIPQNRANWIYGLLAAATLASAAIFLRPKNIPYLLASIIGGGLLACIALFHGSTNWWDIAIHFGTIHWPYMFIGPTSNLPAVFELRFGWPDAVDQIALTLPAIHSHWPGFITSRQWWPAVDLDVTSKTLFSSLYIVMLVICGIGIGLQARRNDRRMLVALVTPWIMFFLIPTQIQERYLVYGAAVAACCIGQSAGTALLGFLLTLFSMCMEVNRMMNVRTADLDALGQNLSRAFPRIFSTDSGRTLLRFFDALHPDIAWGILVIGLVFLYLSLIPSPNPSSRRRSAASAV